MSKKPTRLLFFIVLFALLLRLVGIQHGFPFIFHPDEPTIVRSALGVRFDLNPAHFDWPHLYIYANYFVYIIFAKFRDLAVLAGLKPLLSSWLPILWNDDLIFYLLTRIFSAVLSALTVIPIYKAGKNLFGEKVGLLSALTFTILPFSVWHAHYALPDMPMVFLLAWAMYFSTKIFTDGTPASFSTSGLFAGLSASSKYNGGLSAVTVPWALLLRFIASKLKLINEKVQLFSTTNILNVIIAAFCAVFGFVLGTPYAVLDYETFTRTDGPKGAFWQFTNVGSLNITDHLNRFVSDLIYKLSDDLGYTVLVGLILVFGLVLVRFIKRTYSKYDLAILLVSVPAMLFIYYISGFSKSRSHYYLIIYPFVSVAFGYFSLWLIKRVGSIKKWFSLPVFLLLFIPPFYMSAVNAVRYIQNDTRLDLYSYLKNNVGAKAPVVYDSSDFVDLLKVAHPGSIKGIANAPKNTVLYYISEDPIVGASSYVFEAASDLKLGPAIYVAQVQR